MMILSAYEPSSNPRDDIKDPLERIIPLLIKKLVGPDAYAWHSTMMLMFNHIDFLGHLYGGGSLRRKETENAVKFIRNYLGQVDTRYGEVGGLLYFMVRHGLTHRSHPKRFRFQNGKVLGFVFSTTRERSTHLMVTSELGELRLKFSISLFYEDLLNAIELYCQDIGQTTSVRKDFEKAWRILGEPETEEHVNQHYKYIRPSDLDFVKKNLTLPIIPGFQK